MRKQIDLQTIDAEIQSLVDNFLCFLDSNSKYEEIKCITKKALLEEEKKEILNLSFIGQYSSGKSTLISALTGRKDIKIDANIATDTVSSYQWNGILINDTPGICTDRKDHDTITLEKITKSDLLVYVVTSQLFDDVIFSNFIKLAYEQGLKHKILLVINKMGAEDGEFEDLKASYIKSLTKIFQSHHLNFNDFQTIFVDAQDYIDGIEEDDSEFIEESHFEDLIDTINSFVKERGILGSLTTPLQLLRNAIDSVMELTLNSGQPAQLQLLNRAESKVRRVQKRMLSEFERQKLDANASIRAISASVATAIGIEGEKEFESTLDKGYKDMEYTLKKIEDDYEHLLENTMEELSLEFSKVFVSPLAKDFVINRNDQNFSWEAFVENPSSFDYKKYLGYGEEISAKIFKCSGGGKGMLTSKIASGSMMKDGVYKVGKMFGHKFKPWGAAKMAKNIGNFAAGFGASLQIVGAVMDLKNEHEETKRQSEIKNAKNDCRSQFVDFGERIIRSLDRNCEEFIDISFVDVINDLEDEKQKIYNEGIHNDMDAQLLKDLRLKSKFIESRI